MHSKAAISRPAAGALQGALPWGLAVCGLYPDHHEETESETPEAEFSHVMVLLSLLLSRSKYKMVIVPSIVAESAFRECFRNPPPVGGRRAAGDRFAQLSDLSTNVLVNRRGCCRADRREKLLELMLSFTNRRAVGHPHGADACPSVCDLTPGKSGYLPRILGSAGASGDSLQSDRRRPELAL
ncbi:hypothetical protein EVAR_33311_1 [Eumeta japonica]|uniref:Uncharacterized protein n=1 Tax=Eumeta variegata TaxID=151549 RepID=A0A4C1WHS2_EUMVA|nr:hypothetical protein EVAR_33311_1 [Eumeta japonica]